MKRKSLAALVSLASSGGIRASVPQQHRLYDRNVCEEIAEAYPSLSAAQVNEKLETAKTPWEFFRATVPYFYLKAKKEKIGEDPNSTLLPLLKLRGWCVADAHLENFGSWLNRDAKISFEMNDADDAGEGPLFYDFLRALSSVKIGAPEFNDFSGLFSRYAAGLGLKKLNLSDAVEAFLKKRAAKGAKPRGNDLADEKESDPTELARDEDHLREVEGGERAELLALFKAELGAEIEMRDLFAYTPKSGGSGQRLRYRALVYVGKEHAAFPPGASQVQIVELKTIAPPAIAIISDEPVPSAEFRFARSVAIMNHSNDIPPIWRTVKFRGSDFLLKPRWASNVSVKVEDFSAPDLHDLIRDEFGRLGEMHAAAAPPEWAERWGQSSREEWLKEADKMVAFNLEKFKASRPAH